jgi:hypothetical protein
MEMLNAAESARLAACELVIETGLTAFVAVGKALTEIRDSKLYRQDHKTFEAYCKEQWEIGKSRAYQLIEQAEVAVTLAKATGDLSNALDISQRDAHRLKQDLPAAAAAVRQRVEAGEDPKAATAAVVERSRAVEVDRTAEHQRQRDEAQAKLPQSIRDVQQKRREAATTAVQNSTIDAQLAELAELREANAVLEAENVRLRADLAEMEGMRAQYEQGGFDKIIAGKDEEIRVLQTRVAAESRDKVSYMRTADYWKEQAGKLGFNDTIDIDLATGAVTTHG